MIPKGILGPVWRIAPAGCVEVFVCSRRRDNTATVTTKAHQGGWARKQIDVALKDLFLEEEDCRVEYAVRKAAALTANPSASLNLTTPLQEA